MTHYRLTPDAKSDLIEIRHFTIKQWDLAQSQKYVSELRQTIRLLADAPSLGRARLDVGTACAALSPGKPCHLLHIR